MKKSLIVLCLLGVVLAGCAAGINHNVANINGKTYLVETKTDNVLGLYQYSQPSKLIDLQSPNVTKDMAKSYVQEVAAKCQRRLTVRAENEEKKKAQRNITYRPKANVQADPKDVYECIIEALTE